MKRIVLLFVLLYKILAATDVYAQGWAWGRGSTGSGTDAWAVATDGSGNVYGASLKDNTGITVFGSYSVMPSPTPSPYGLLALSQTVWVKYNSSGTVLWADGIKSGNTWLYNIATDPTGNLIIFGEFSSDSMKIGSITLHNAYSSGTWQYFLAKVSPGGTVLWAVNDGEADRGYIGIMFMFAPILGVGGVTTDAAGNIYITSSFDKPHISIGTYTLTNSNADSTNDIYVVKYSPSGTLLWATSIGGASQDYGYGIAVSSIGNVCITGAFYSPSVTVGPSVIGNAYGASYPNAYIAEFSCATGAPLWAQAAGGPYGAFGVGVTSDASGDVYMTGGFSDTVISFGSTTIHQTYPVAGKMALYLVKYSPTGAVVWSKTIGSPTEPLWGYSIALAACEQVWVSGNYKEAASIDGAILPLVPGEDPVFIVGYDASGMVAGYSGLSSGGDDQNGIAADGSGNVYMCSDYSSSVTGGIVIGPDTLPSQLSENFYIGKYNTRGSDTIYSHWDTTIGCAPVSEVLTAPPGYSSCYWDDGSTMPTRIITGPGTYWVYNFSTTCGAPVFVDTFHVTTITSGAVYTHQDTTFACALISTALTAPPGYSAYYWDDGSTMSTRIITATGIYWVRSTTCGIPMLVDTFHVAVTVPDTIYGYQDTVIGCSPITEILTAPSGYTSYYWDNGSTLPVRTITAAGTYWVYNTVCGAPVFADTFHVAATALDTIHSHQDTLVCTNSDVYQITLTAPAGGSYTWYDGNTGESDTVWVAGNYWVSYTIGCITDTDTFNVSTIPRPQPISGYDTVYVDSVITLSDATPGGVWTSATVSIAIVDSSTGLVIGISPGIATVNYSVSTDCYVTENITVLSATASVNSMSPAVGSVQILPNPTTNELTILQSTNQQFNQFTITNSIGQEMITLPIAIGTKETQVNVSALPPGVYYITFRGDNGTNPSAVGSAPLTTTLLRKTMKFVKLQ